jgi:GT2 family glycosyltransferase
MALVDVVVVAYNSRDVLRTCVEPFLGDEEIHTIVVDNASPDDSGDAVANLAVTLVGERDNRGFGAGCNAGWRAGSAPYVLFLNPDAELTANAVKTLGRALAVDTTVGAVGPRILERGGALDHSIRRFPRLSSTYAQAFFLHRLSRTRSWGDEVVRDDAKYASSHDVEWLSGACLMVRRSALEQLQGFDEGFFMYCEDTDLCQRVWKLGLRVRYVAEAQAIHDGGLSAPRSSLLPTLAASRVRYARLHDGRAVAELTRLGVAAGSLAHAAVGRGSREARAGYLACASTSPAHVQHARCRRTRWPVEDASASTDPPSTRSHSAPSSSSSSLSPSISHAHAGRSAGGPRRRF